MPNESLHVEPHHERLDADAVCERCGTVNPEDTLLCKTCGNNLRDQRMRRIAAGGEEQAVAPKSLRWSWLASILTVLGLVLLVWAALNAEEIMQGVFAADETTAIAKSFWETPKSAVYEELKTELQVNPVTPEAAQSAMRSALPINDFTGRYAIMSASGTPVPMGSGIARQDGQTIYFLATLDRGLGEIRGEAQLVGTTPAAKDTAAIYHDGIYELASGVALKRDGEANGYLCHAQTTVSNPVSFLIFKLP